MPPCEVEPREVEPSPGLAFGGRSSVHDTGTEARGRLGVAVGLGPAFLCQL